MARVVHCSVDLYSKNYRRNAQEIEYKIFVMSKSKIFFSIIYKSKTKHTKFQIYHTVAEVVNITIIVAIGFKRKILQIVLRLSRNRATFMMKFIYVFKLQIKCTMY